MKIIRFIFIISVWVSFSAQAIVMRHDVREEKYLELAKENLSVVTFYGKYQGKEIVEGTGTLIASDWIVTAAHVANYLKVNGKVKFRDTDHKIKQVIKHPNWSDRQIPNDIALVQLQSSVTHAKPAELYAGNNELNQLVTFVGRGDFGNGKSGIIGADDKLRAAQNMVTQVDEKWIRFVFDSDKNALPLEGISGPGDSGGPALLTIDDTSHIVGVSSWQDTQPTKGQEGKYGVIENYVRVSFFKPWIEMVLAQQMKNSGKDIND